MSDLNEDTKKIVKTLIEYKSAPDAESFAPASLDELRAIQADIAASEKSALATEWSRAAWECDREACELAILAAERGEQVLIAEDEDGYYFATAEAKPAAKKLGKYATLCESCASTLNAKQYGQADKNYCEACGTVHEAQNLATYDTKPRKEGK